MTFDLLDTAPVPILVPLVYHTKVLPEGKIYICRNLWKSPRIWSGTMQRLETGSDKAEHATSNEKSIRQNVAMYMGKSRHLSDAVRYQLFVNHFINNNYYEAWSWNLVCANIYIHIYIYLFIYILVYSSASPTPSSNPGYATDLCHKRLKVLKCHHFPTATWSWSFRYTESIMLVLL